MEFSIVIPVYNTAAYLEACVQSVTCSPFLDYEILLIDDGSTDGVCPALCDQLAARQPERIRVIHQKNRGLGGARNTGIEAATGTYLLFLDSDDSQTPCLSWRKPASLVPMSSRSIRKIFLKAESF